MNRIVVCLSIVAIAAIPAPASAQAPKAEKSIIGNWVLKSTTIDGKKATPKQLSALLKYAGGAKPGMIYKIRRNNTISMNGKDTHYEYAPENRELEIEFSTETEPDSGMMFEVRLIGPDLRLSFKDGDRPVEMLFTPEN